MKQKTLIYSFLALDPAESYIGHPLTEMLDLWHRHLRGPGRYTGDIILFTNCEHLALPGIRTLPFAGWAHEARNFFHARVLNHVNVPANDYDVVLQTDLDILAVNDVSPLFQLDSPFRAAASGLNLYDARHVGNARQFPFDFWRKWLPGQHARRGVSACVFACQGTQWTPCMSAWSRLTRQHQHKPLAYSDQTILNLAYARRSFPIRSFPPSYILHRDWGIHPDTILLHFPLVGRLDFMRKFSLV